MAMAPPRAAWPQAGIDGVEVVASHGYLPAQFLNPRLNLREDGYGGSFENRLRFLREAIAACRDAVGPERVVGMRISGAEMDHDGLDRGRGAGGLPGAFRRWAARLLQCDRGQLGQHRRRHTYRAAHGDRHRLCGALRRRGAPGRGQAGLRRRPHQPAPDRRAGPGLGPGRSLRHDPGDDLRSRDAGQDRRRQARRHPRLHRLQPGLHRAFPSGLCHLLHPASRDRARDGVWRGEARRPPQARAHRRRRPGGHEGRGHRRRARP